MILYYLLCAFIMFGLHELAIKFHPRVDSLKVNTAELLIGHIGGVVPVLLLALWVILQSPMTALEAWWVVFWGFASAGVGTGIGWAFDWIILIVRDNRILHRERRQWEEVACGGPEPA